MTTEYHVYTVDTDEQGANALRQAHPQAGASVLRLDKNGLHDTKQPVTGLKLVSSKPLTIDGARYEKRAV